MDKVKIPDSLSISGWNAVKNDIAKDKALASKVQGESAKLTSALAALDKAHSAFDFGLGDPKDVTAAAAADRGRQVRYGGQVEPEGGGRRRHRCRRGS